MRYTYSFFRQIPWCRDDNGHPQLTFSLSDDMPEIRRVLWSGATRQYEFQFTDGNILYVPERNIAGILYEKDLPGTSDRPDK